jgi:hypothetical protein
MEGAGAFLMVRREGAGCDGGAEAWSWEHAGELKFCSIFRSF